jgi:hypothetical protein
MSLLTNVTDKTTKAQLLEILRKADREMQAKEDSRVARMQEIEERVRAAASEPAELKTIMNSASLDEWRETNGFLDNFEDLLPAPLARLREGLRVLFSE